LVAAEERNIYDNGEGREKKGKGNGKVNHHNKVDSVRMTLAFQGNTKSLREIWGR